MDVNPLAFRIIQVIVQSLTGVLSGPAAPAANELRDLVFDTFRDTPGGLAFQRLAEAPTSRSRQKDAQSTLFGKLAADPDFRRHATDVLDWTAFHDESRTSTTVTASGRATAAGRDLNSTTNKTNYGGLVVGLFAVVVIIVLAVAWPKIQSVLQDVTSGTGMNANTTCREFLAADTGSQAEIMKKVYLDANKPNLAGDPFIVQNADYFCGQEPDVTLGQLAASRNNN